MTSLLPGARAELSSLLRQARNEARLTQDAVARAITKDRTTVTHAETGHPPSEDVLSDILRATGVTGLAESAIWAVWRLARTEGDGAPSKLWTSGYVAAEEAASTIRIWCPSILHGVLQQSGYSRALFGVAGMSADEVAEQVRLRGLRQAIFGRADPPRVIALVDEVVLRRQVGTPQDMREQLARLANPPRSVTVQVVPQLNAGVGGAVTLAEGPSGTVLLADGLVEDMVTRDTELIQRAASIFDDVRGDAYPKTQSRQLVLEAVEHYERLAQEQL
jgi:transcriptional regulator with XRE-family HTH domain